jgi:membrane-associated phospholipid phosphatase
MTACRGSVGLVLLSAALVVPVPALAQTAPEDSPQQVARSIDSVGTVRSEESASTATPFVRSWAPSFPSLFTSLGNDLRQLTTSHSFLIMGVGGAAAFGTHAFDGRLATTNLRSGSIDHVFAPGQIVGGMYVQAGAAFATYVAGRATGSPRLAQVGAELVRAQFVAQGVTQTIKISAPRTRPDGTPFSFPSGHTASSFATATVLQREFGWKVGIPAYIGAAWVGASRIESERHYLSDVVAGATVGILAGHAVTVGSGPARFSLGPMAVPGGIGVGFVRVK